MEYTYTNFNNFQPVQLETYNNQIPDYKEIPELCLTEYDYFKLIYTDKLLEQIKIESIRYIEEIFEKKMGQIGEKIL